MFSKLLTIRAPFGCTLPGSWMIAPTISLHLIVRFVPKMPPMISVKSWPNFVFEGMIHWTPVSIRGMTSIDAPFSFRARVTGACLFLMAASIVYWNLWLANSRFPVLKTIRVPPTLFSAPKIRKDSPSNFNAAILSLSRLERAEAVAFSGWRYAPLPCQRQ